MAVEWIRKAGEGRRHAMQETLAVTVDQNAVVLSAAMRRELLAEHGQDQPLRIMVGVRRGNLAVAKADPADPEAWLVNKSTGRTSSKQVLGLLAAKGVAEGRYIMRWNPRSRCYMSIERQEVRRRRRRGTADTRHADAQSA